MAAMAARVMEGARERTAPALMIAAGMALLFILAFDQGQLLSRMLGETAYQKNFLHEFFHDGRHLFAFACH
jgi:hypothetical protein